MQRGVWYLVMEYVEGRDLSTLVKERGPLAVDEAVDCILQAARGLAYAHGKGVIHRDIKPANLLLDNEGTVKILDMGLARFDNSGDAADHQLTNTGQVMGTVDYMAPEQAASTHDADARSDIYSLGCALFRLLTGGNVYEGETLVKKLFAHASDPIPSIRTKRPEAPAEIDRIFQKMVAKRPADRYQRTTELVAELEAYLNPGATTAYSAASVSDSKLSDFLRQQSAATVQTPSRATAPAVENTASNVEPESATDAKHLAAGLVLAGSAAAARSSTARGQAPRLKSKPPLKLIAGGIGGLALLVAFGIWVIVKDKDGNEVARMKVPDGGNVSALPSPLVGEGPGVRGGASVPAPTPSSGPPVGGPPSLIKGEGLKPVGPQPPPAVAPFDAQTARAHQDAWAKHLGVKVETPNSVGQTMILIPPGEFLMGSTDAEVEAALKAADEIKADQPTKDRIQKNERPQHKVVITKPFWMSATEVTIGQFKKFSATGYVTEAETAAQDATIMTYLSGGSDDLPAAYITWNDAVAYCDWLTKQETVGVLPLGGNGPAKACTPTTYRLPTEAEWEYACRAGTTTQYSYGDDYNELPKYGWHNMNAGGKSHPVGTLLPNPFGLFDMHGNLHEWCRDYFVEKWYSISPPNDPIGPSAGSSRVVRGGQWFFHASICRSASRPSHPPSGRYNSSGFRYVSAW